MSLFIFRTNLFTRIFFLAWCAWVSTEVGAQNLNFRNYTADDHDLPSSNIYAAFQDSKGFMWFATDRGVSRFDGYGFTNFNVKDGLSDREVFNFFEDSKGRIWFEARNGKVSFYKDGDFFNSSIDTMMAPLDSKSYISMIREDSRGNILITTLSDGIVVYRPNGTITRFFSHGELPNIHGVFFLKDQAEVLVATQRGTFGVIFSNSYTSVRHVKFYSVGKEIESHRTQEINDEYPKFAHLQGKAIFYKDYNRLYRCDLEKGTYEVEYPFDHSMYMQVLRDNGNDQFWIGTTNGATLYDRTQRKILNHVLKGRIVTDIKKDLEGNYWFTTYGDGIFFCTSLEMFSYTAVNGLLVNKVTCVSADKQGRLWLGYARGNENYTGASISYVRNGDLRHLLLTDKKSMNKTITREISFGKGDRCWISTTQGIFLVENGKVRLRPSYTRQVIEYQPTNTVWHTTSRQLVQMSVDVFRDVMFNASEFDMTDPREHRWGITGEHKKWKAKVRKMYVDSRSNLWIANEGQILKIAGDSIKQIQPQQLGIEVEVNDIAELPDNTLVFATNGQGVVFVKDGNFVTTVAEDQGLSSNICTAVRSDSEGMLWVATDNGLNKIASYRENVKIDYVSVFDGLLSNEITDVEVLHDTVWVATGRGLNFFHRDHIRKPAMSPRVYIERLTVRGIPVRERQDTRLVFEYRQNDIGIKYTGLLFNNGEPLMYRYKLHPEDAWRYTKSTSVYLPALPPDSYEFMVSASGHAGKWSDDAVMSFEITEPFWKSSAFIVMIILLILGLVIIAIYTYIFQQKKEMERQHRVTLSELRSLRAQMNPHFLFNALNSIQGVLLKQSKEVTQDYLGKFGKLMRTILDHADRSSVTVSEELESIKNYLEIEQLRANQFQYVIDIDPTLDIFNREIPAMILQPFVENSIWHGFAHREEENKLVLGFHLLPDDDLKIEIRDNGIGRKKASELRSVKHRSKGIQLVKERIDILNYKAPRKILLEIHDLGDKDESQSGTMVILIIPPL